jgi:hypothetical protein
MKGERCSDEELLEPGGSRKKPIKGEFHEKGKKNEESQMVFVSNMLCDLHWSFGSPGQGS